MSYSRYDLYFPPYILLFPEVQTPGTRDVRLFSILVYILGKSLSNLSISQFQGLTCYRKKRDSHPP